MPMVTAPGMWINGSILQFFVSLPRRAFEMKVFLMEHQVIPQDSEGKYSRPFIVHKTIITYGIGEQCGLPEKIQIGKERLPPP